MADSSDRSLEQELRALGRALDVPPGPDLTDAVRSALAAGEPSTGRFRRRWPGAVRWLGSWLPSGRSALSAAGRRRRALRYAAALLAAALVAVFIGSPQVRAAVAEVLRFAGVEVHWGQRHGPPPSGIPASRPPGRTVDDVAEAGRLVGFAVRVPTELGQPDEVKVTGFGRPTTVSLLYRAAAGRPKPGPEGVAARLDQFKGTLLPGFSKRVDPGTPRDYVELGDGEALWLATPHEVVYVDEKGEQRTETARLAGSTLIWQQGGVAFRLEGAFTRDEAVAVARSLR